ncbi:hypothetical protein H311_01828 [Anncaliia algerae PRA109]|nr:hypothetical protein H311_01828 [Anncaliia algerae PRA109]
MDKRDARTPSTTKWEQKTSVIFIKSLIRVPYKRSYNSYENVDQIFEDLQREYYSEENLYYYRNCLNMLKQKSFHWIDEYIDEIKINLGKLGCCMRLSKKQVEEKFDEYFLNGLSF